MGLFDFFKKKETLNTEEKDTLDKGLEKTKSGIFDKISRVVVGKSTVDEDVLDELEEILISSDVGVETTLKIIKRIEKRAADDKYVNAQELNTILRDEIAALLTENNSDDVADFDVPVEKKPYVIMVVGVNGVGKTTTIGKLAYQFKKAGKSVYLGAADTFRAPGDRREVRGQADSTRRRQRRSRRKRAAPVRAGAAGIRAAVPRGRLPVGRLPVRLASSRSVADRLRSRSVLRPGFRHADALAGR